MGNVDFQFLDGVVKSIPRYSILQVSKKSSFCGIFVNQNHSLEFVYEECFVRDHNTQELIAYAHQKNG